MATCESCGRSAQLVPVVADGAVFVVCEGCAP